MASDHKDYQYEIDQCDVEDKELLREFREKRKAWKTWLEDDEHHSIRSQIHTLMWNDAVYRGLNEARRFASPEKPTASMNGALGEFLDMGYVSTQVSSISKLTDVSKDDPKGVISLRRLFDDIKRHRHFFTRENFIAYDGLPYDWAQVQQNYYAGLTQEQLSTRRWLPTKGPKAWGTSQLMHKAFDKLSRVSESERSREDIIHNDVLSVVENLFDDPALKKIRSHRNKFVSHAADEFSRKAASLERFGLSLDDFDNAHKIIIRIATEISSKILYDVALGGIVPTAQFEVFEYMDLPLVPPEHLQDLSNWWHEHSQSRNSWLTENENEAP